MLAAASCRLVALLTANVTPSRTGLHSHCGMLCTSPQPLLLSHGGGECILSHTVLSRIYRGVATQALADSLWEEAVCLPTCRA